MNTGYIGLDISPTHGAAVVLDKDGSVIDWRALSKTKKEASVDSRITRVIPRRTETDYDIYNAVRRWQITNLIEVFITSLREDVDVLFGNIEHYSMGLQSASVTGCAEIGGILRDYMFTKKIPYLETSPKSLKLFAAENGNATKGLIYSTFFLEKDESFFGIEDADLLVKQGKKDIDGVFTDILDAYYLAELLRIKALLNVGEICYEGLPEHCEKVFEKTTKKHPVNLRERPLIDRRSFRSAKKDKLT